MENLRIFIFMILSGLICSCAIANDKTKTLQKVAAGSNAKSATPSVGVYYYPWYRANTYKWRQAMRLHQQARTRRIVKRNPLALIVDAHSQAVLTLAQSL